PMSGTELDPVLRNLGVRTIVAVGVSVNVAIANLVFDAVNAGYQVVVPRDAVAGLPPSYVDAVFDHTLGLLATVTTAAEVLRVREEALREVEQALERLAADPGPLGRVGRQERRARVALFQVLDDRARLVERDAVVLERRHLAVRAARQVCGRLVLALLEAQQHGLVDEPLLLEHELHAPREGRARAVVEADHRGPPSP